MDYKYKYLKYKLKYLKLKIKLIILKIHRKNDTGMEEWGNVLIH